MAAQTKAGGSGQPGANLVPGGPPAPGHTEGAPASAPPRDPEPLQEQVYDPGGIKLLGGKKLVWQQHILLEDGKLDPFVFVRGEQNELKN